MAVGCRLWSMRKPRWVLFLSLCLMDLGVDGAVKCGRVVDVAYAITLTSGCSAEHLKDSVCHGYGSPAGLVASRSSVLMNTPCPDDIRFHIVVKTAKEAFEVCQSVLMWSAAPGLSVARPSAKSLPHCVPQPDAAVAACACGGQDYLYVLDATPEALRAAQEHLDQESWLGSTDRADLQEISVFARNAFDKILLKHGVTRVLYLDMDTVVQKDVRLLWDVPMMDSHIAAAVLSCDQRFSDWYDVQHPVVKATIPAEKWGCYINAGVFLMDLQKFNDAAIWQRINALYKQQERRPLWKQGKHQPAFVLALFNNTLAMPGEYHVTGLGWQRGIPEAKISAAVVLHWTGHGKPWMDSKWYGNRWEPYSPRRPLLTTPIPTRTSSVRLGRKTGPSAQ